MNYYPEKFAAMLVGLVLVGVCVGIIATHKSTKPTESTAALQEQIQELQSIVTQRDGELESYRMYASKTAASLVDLNIQLREKTNECERLQRENLRLERRAMGLVVKTSRKPTRRERILAALQAVAGLDLWVWLLAWALSVGLAFWAGKDWENLS